MPQLRQYVSTAQPQGFVQGVIPDSPRVGGLVAGIAGAANAMQRGADIRQHQVAQLQAEQERETQRIQIEEAQASVSLMDSNARADWTERLINRQNNGPAAGMTAELTGEFDRFAEQAVASAPELGRKALTARLQDLKLHIHERAFSYEAKARREQVVTDFQSGRDADLLTLMADPSQFQNILASRTAAAANLVLDETTKAELINDTRERLAYTAASGIVNRNPDAFLQRAGMAGGKTGKDGQPLPVDPKKAAEAVANDPVLSNMKPEQLGQLVDRATALSIQRKAQAEAEAARRASQAEAAAAKRDRDASQAYTVLSDWARDGKRADPVESAALMEKLSASPMLLKAYQAQAAEIPQRTAVAMLTLEQQRKRVDSLIAQRNAQGTSQALEAEIKKSEESLKSAEQEYKADPLRAAAERGVIPALAPLDMSTPEAMVPGLQMRVQQADEAAQKVGRFVSPFTSEEARKFADDMQKMPVAEKEKRLGLLAKTIGLGRMGPVMAQIGKDAPRLAVAGGMVGSMTTAGRSTARNILEGDALLQAKQFKMPTDARMMEAFAKQVGDAIPTIEGRQAAMEAATAIYAKLRAERGHAADTTVDSTAWSEAVSQVTGGVVEHNGRKLLPVRYGEPPSVTRSLLRGVNAEQVKQWGGVVGMTDQEAADYIRDAAIESVSVGRYRVAAGASILQRKDGAPFEMVFR